MKGGEKSKFGGTIILEMYEPKMTNATSIHTLCVTDSRLTWSPAGCWFDHQLGLTKGYQIGIYCFRYAHRIKHFFFK